MPVAAIATGRPLFSLATMAELSELAAIWLDLEQRAAPPVFLGWDWIGSWLREVARPPVVLTARVDGRVVLLAALMTYARRDRMPVAVHGLQLHMTGDTEQDVITVEYNGFLVDLAWVGRIEADAIAFLLRGVAVDGQKCDELHLKNVPASLAPAVAAAALPTRGVQSKPSWRVDLAAIRATGGDYRNSLSANTRQQIRRSIRLYEQRGPLRLRRACEPAEARAFLDGLRELHQEYWVGRGERGAFAYPFFVRFQQRLIDAGLPHGTIELARITAGSDVIGYVYNLVYRGHVYAYQTGIRYEGDPRLKPGLVCHSLCIDQHLRDGSAVYDFMAGDARYKASLGRRGPDMLYLLVQRATWMLQLENAVQGIRRRLRGGPGERATIGSGHVPAA